MFSLYINLYLDGRIFDYLRTSMAAVQAEDVRAYYLFVGDVNGHHHERMVGFYNHESPWCCSV